MKEGHVKGGEARTKEGDLLHHVTLAKSTIRVKGNINHVHLINLNASCIFSGPGRRGNGLPTDILKE